MTARARITGRARARAEYLEDEQRRQAAEFYSLTAAARARGEAWIAWIDAGCPQLTEAEYAAQGGRHAPGGSSSRRAASARAAL